MIPQFSEQRISDLLYNVINNVSEWSNVRNLLFLKTFLGRLPLLTRPLQCTSDIAGVSPLEAQHVETLGICPSSKMEALEYNSNGEEF